MTTVIFLYGVIYTIINAWILYYIGHSFVSPLPWTTCDNEWNSQNCISHQGYKCQSKYHNMTTNETDAVTSYKQYNASLVNATVVCTTNGSWITAPEEFWRYIIWHLPLRNDEKIKTKLTYSIFCSNLGTPYFCD